MDLLDANILIGAFRPDDPNHSTLKDWLEKTLNEGYTVTFPALVEVAFLRIVTHPRIFRVPSPLAEAVAFLQGIQASGLFRETGWTTRMRKRWWNWCQDLELRGNDVNDAYSRPPPQKGVVAWSARTWASNASAASTGGIRWRATPVDGSGEFT